MQESTGYLTIDAWTQFLWHLPDNPSITLSLSQHKAKIPLHWYLSPPVLLGSYFFLRLLSPAVLWQMSLRRDPVDPHLVNSNNTKKTLFFKKSFSASYDWTDRDRFYVLSFVMRGWMRGHAVASHWFYETGIPCLSEQISFPPVYPVTWRDWMERFSWILWFYPSDRGENVCKGEGKLRGQSEFGLNDFIIITVLCQYSKIWSTSSPAWCKLAS